MGPVTHPNGTVRSELGSLSVRATISTNTKHSLIVSAYGQVVRICMLLLVFAGLFPMSVRPLGAENSEKDAGEVGDVTAPSAAVTLLRSGGYWCDGERRGFYRALVWSGGFEEVYHHLYVQLFEINVSTKKITLGRTMPIKETMGLDLVINDFKLQPDGGDLCAGIVIEGTARRRSDSGTHDEHFRVRVAQDGRYTALFERQPEPAAR